MANTYTLIASNTVGSGGTAQVDFTSIPQTYTDLLLLNSTRGASGVGYNLIRFNSSSSNFSTREIQGNGSGVSSNSDTGGRAGSYNASTFTASTFANDVVYIPNYTSSNYKSYSVDKVSEQDGTEAYAELIAGLWSQTAAITTLKFIAASSSDLAQYSTAYLYGISNA